MIASFVNDNHETWNQFLRKVAYALRTAVHETMGKTPEELFLDRKLITPFQKLVSVSDGAEFVVGNIEKLLKAARQSTRIIHEKWAKYYNKRRREVNNRVNGLVLVETHPISSATKKKAGRRTTVIIDQVRIYHQRKNDERVVDVESSVSSVSEYQSSSLEENRPRLDLSQGYRNSEFAERQVEQGKKQQYKKTRQDVMRYKRKVPASRSVEPEKKKNRRPIRETNKRALMSSAASTKQVKKRVKKSKENFGQLPAEDPGPEEGSLQSSRIQQGRPSSYNLRHRRDVTRKAGSRPSGRTVQALGVQSGPEENHLVGQALTPSIVIVTNSLSRV
ncbi:uncharacterized protein TNCV_4348601 [Trichonephila clavipes]|nr:uncharacterized protein TNCV_4348601 [Trichonephila clavipes]